MKNVTEYLMIWLLLNATAVTDCCSQANSSSAIVKSIAAKVEKLSGQKFNVSGIEMDKALRERSKRIRDPYHTLEDCFIFLAADVTSPISARLKGFIGIHKVSTDSVLWQSTPLSFNFSSGALGGVEETNELNRDGKVEIIVRQGKEPVGTGQLWIFTWDGRDGKLVTKLDNYGESVVMYYGDKYDLKDMDGDGIYEIQGEWYNDGDSVKTKTVTYAWNGTLYGNWGKSSRSLLRGVKR